jgi:hypothetical protein
MDFNIDGLVDLQQDLTKAIRLYPDMAEQRLRRITINFRKDVIEEEKKVIKNDDVRTKNKLTTTQGFTIGKTRGYNENMEVDFSAKSKIFHLVENGHQITKGGQSKGWVKGNYVVKKMRIKYAEYVMPFEMDKLLTDITKACKL